MPTTILPIPPSERSTQRATMESWQTIPIPAKREPLGFSACFDAAESETLKRGFVPSDMDDRWFICFDAGWLRFYRSWTGICIFGLRLETGPAGTCVMESWVNREPDQYRGVDVKDDRELVQRLINELLLQKAGVVGDQGQNE